MKKLLVSLLPVALVATAVAQPIDIPAPGGVGDVIALTNALTRSDLYDTIRLAPGVYDLSDVAMEADSHLVMQSGKRLLGLGATPGETVLRGGGAAVGRRIAKFEYANYSHATASNLTFTGGYIAGLKNGGGLHGAANVLVQDCIFSNNVCGGSWQGGGGGVYMARAERCLFIDNRALGKNIEGDSKGSDGAHGGGLWCNSDHNLNDTADWQGAYDCVFSNNVAYTRGGGLYGQRAECCTFVGGQADYGGGASGCVLVDSTFEGNVALYGWGGGAHEAKAVTNCVFRRNVAQKEHSGGLWTNGDVPVIGCTFEENTANRAGGGLSCRGGLVSNCVFRCNVSRATTGGGGLYAPAPNADSLLSTFRVVDCLFEGNNSSTYGGGAIAPGGFMDCTFRTNVCQKGGGGVYCARESPEIGFVGCVFEGNEVAGWAHGGGLLSSDSTNGTKVCDSVFTANRASGYATAAACATLDHCIVTNHQDGAFVLLNCNLNGCTVADNACAKDSGVSCDTWRTDLAGAAGANAAYTNANCVFRGNKAVLASIVANKTCLNCTFVANEVGVNYGTVVSENSILFNCVFLENKVGDRLSDFNSGRDGTKNVPFLTNCVYSAADVDPQTSARCADCFPASRVQLRFTRRFAEARPFEPRRASPLVNRAFSPAWLTEALGATDVYGNSRIQFGGLDIGAAECSDLGPGGVVVIR